MKKIICIILLLFCLGMTVNANPNMNGDVGDINVPMSSPSVDGYINTNEGWSEGVYAYKDIMATFGNCNEILQSFYLYYAYDSEGIYYAADVLDNTFILSTGEDDIDNKINDFNIKNENVYGYNGDIFTFTVDPIGLFMDAGYYGNQDYNAWYSVGIFEGNICRMYRGHNRSGDITSEVRVQGHTTDEGWCFEAFIPWEFLCQDAEDMSYAEFSPSVEDMIASGAKHRAMAIYMDRYYDPEGEEITTFQRFATCGYILPDGLLGYLSSGVCLKAYGITLNLEGTGADDTAADTTETSEPIEDTTADRYTQEDSTYIPVTTVPSDTSDEYTDKDTVSQTATTSSDSIDTTSGINDTETDKSADSKEQPSSVTVEKESDKNTADTTETSDKPVETSGKDPADSTKNTKDNGKIESTSNTKAATSQKSTTKTQITSKPQGTESGSAQTFDMGVALAIGGVVIAVIAFVFLKKKR